MIAAATAIAACGSNSPGSRSASSSAGRPTQAQMQQDAVNFARCMRSHGVPDFADPTSPREFKISLNPSTAQSPAFQSAQTSCRHLLPGGGPRTQSTAQNQARAVGALAFARCLRSHGFPSFPDPTSRGELTHEMLAGAGINPHQPALLQAADACVSVTHGVITKADVARFAAQR